MTESIRVARDDSGRWNTIGPTDDVYKYLRSFGVDVTSDEIQKVLTIFTSDIIQVVTVGQKIVSACNLTQIQREKSEKDRHGWVNRPTPPPSSSAIE